MIYTHVLIGGGRGIRSPVHVILSPDRSDWNRLRGLRYPVYAGSVVRDPIRSWTDTSASSMQPRIAISRKWFDEDVLLLTFQVCDGRSLFTTEAYTQLDWGTKASKGLAAFMHQIHGGLYNLEAGDGGPEYASGAFRARFHWYTPAHLVINTTQQGDFFDFKATQVAPEAKMFIRTDAALLDRFVATLPSLDNSGTEVVLECQAVL